MRRRFDVGRTGLALLAAVLAGLGAYAAAARLPIAPLADTALVLLSAEAGVGLLVALWPARAWSRNRRAAAAALAFGGFVLMLPGPIISAIMVPGCVCPAGADYSPFGLLGVSHQYWMIAGMTGFPLLMAGAAVIPGREPRAETPVGPGA